VFSFKAGESLGFGGLGFRVWGAGSFATCNSPLSAVQPDDGFPTFWQFGICWHVFIIQDPEIWALGVGQGSTAVAGGRRHCTST